jgi:hypothetical protein
VAAAAACVYSVRAAQGRTAFAALAALAALAARAARAALAARAVSGAAKMLSVVNKRSYTTLSETFYVCMRAY